MRVFNCTEEPQLCHAKKIIISAAAATANMKKIAACPAAIVVLVQLEHMLKQHSAATSTKPNKLASKKKSVNNAVSIFCNCRITTPASCFKLLSF